MLLHRSLRNAQCRSDSPIGTTHRGQLPDATLRFGEHIGQVPDRRHRAHARTKT